MRDAWKLYDRVLSDVRVAFCDEPNDAENQWRLLTLSSLPSTNAWADAYLAAFAISADFQIVTFDKGFSQYRNLRYAILT